MNDFSHIFAICAYQESEYLESCIRSLKKQTVQSRIIMTTSTPNLHIERLAKRYRIPLYVRGSSDGIKGDWNFAYDAADADWVTIAHQDDEYDPEYLMELQKKVTGISDAIAFVSDYIPIKNGVIGKRDVNSKIRRMLRTPLKNNRLAKSRFWKKSVLCLGNSICCPAVSYHKSVLGNSYFTSDLKYNIDWDTFLKLAEQNGTFAYTDRPLTYYRVHDKATSKEFIQDHRREEEDRIMFRKFWPEWIVRIIMHFYKKAYNTYN